ncbi:TonB-dependent siderophore receptor [Roseibium aggregatum]|uniref:TonB-dependent siderophore receptor n=1 Tax=Roseibium aggregatum TaxID=187304 RepID=A0A939EG08_9HYPH|nr:TonB-dependent siderophore receptor [Roseibium aggregatum]MBN9672303.1 TonB-dependent siderophore receptor [Roseibium aggregatum]
MSRLVSQLTTLHLVATVSIFPLSAAMAQDAAAVKLDTIKVEDIVEQGDGPVEGYVANRSRAGTKTDTPLIKTPQAVSVVPSQQIEDQAADSVSEALRYTAGVATEYRGSSNLHDEMYIRGFGYVPRYVNGLEYGWSSLGQIPPYLLERVEVLKGPSSILYGQSSPGGIVNLVTKQPTGETRREVELVTGLDARIGGNFDFQGTFDKEGVWSYRLVGTGERSDLEEDGLNFEGFAIAPSIRFAPSEDTSITVLSFFTHDPKGGFRNFREAAGTLYSTPHGFIPNDFNVSDPDFEEYRRTQFQIGYEFEHRFNEVFQVRQNAAYNIVDTYHQTLTWGSLDPSTGNISRRPSGGSTDLNQFVIDNQLQSDFDTGAFSHTLLSGVDFKHSMRNYQWGFGDTTGLDINWMNPTYGNLPDIKLNLWTSDEVTRAWQLGAYLQDQIEVGNLTVSLGGRYDWAGTEVDQYAGTDSSFYDSAFSGRAGAIYNFDSGISPYVSYSTSFEPSLETDHNDQPLEPVTAQQWEGGVKYATADGRFQAYASVFHILQQNRSTTDPVTNEVFQTGEIRSQGFELEGHARITENFSLVGSYTYIDAKITEDEDPDQVGLSVDRIPEHQANIWGRYNFTQGRLDGIGLGLGLRYIGPSTDWTNDVKVPSATLLDAMASYDFGAISDQLDGVKLQVNASNLLDKRYTSSCASRWACWYGPGRVVTAKLKYTW